MAQEDREGMSAQEVRRRFCAAVPEGEFFTVEGALRWRGADGTVVRIELTDEQWRRYWERCATVEEDPAMLMALHFHEEIGSLEPGHEEPALIAPNGGFCWAYVPREAREYLGEEVYQRLLQSRDEYRWGTNPE